MRPERETCVCGKPFEFLIYQTMGGGFKVDGHCTGKGKDKCDFSLGGAGQKQCRGGTYEECLREMRLMIQDTRKEKIHG
jgi:hypothetical protein